MWRAQHWWWLAVLVAVGLRLVLLSHHIFSTNNFSLQQDNYANYAVALKAGHLNDGGLSYNDTRLFPGYPWLIAVLSWWWPGSELGIGLMISVTTTAIAVWLFGVWSKQKWTTWLWAVFPPVWVQAGTKVATEPLTLALLLGGLISWEKRWYWWAGLLLGYACTVRFISLFLLLPLGVYALLHKRWGAVLQLSLGAAIWAVIFFAFNRAWWGSGQWLYQMMTYHNNVTVKIGLITFFQNIARTLDWHQYRTLVSGLVYMALTIVGWWGLWVQKKTSPMNMMVFWWVSLSLGFIFLISVDTFIEDFARYTLPIWPALILGLTAVVERAMIAKWQPLLFFKRRFWAWLKV